MLDKSAVNYFSSINQTLMKLKLNYKLQLNNKDYIVIILIDFYLIILCILIVILITVLNTAR
jgi:hypothetical protein